MIGAAHQPHYLPWLGYLDRIQKAERFILLDHVQFERQNYQNRTRIRMGERVQWLSVPVVQRSRDERIDEKRVHNGLDGKLSWGKKTLLTLEHAYGRAPFYGRYIPALRSILQAEWDFLVDLDLALLDFCMKAFDIKTRLLQEVQGFAAALIFEDRIRQG